MKVAELYVPLPLTVVVEVNAGGLVQVALFGPKTLNVIVPDWM